MLCLVAALAACGDKAASKPPPPPPREVAIVTLSAAPVRETGTYLGTLESRGSVTVLPQVGGYVRAILVTPGQRVATGASLIEIDSREQAALLSSASAQVQSATIAVGRAQEALTRVEGLRADGLSSLEEVEQRRADFAAAQAGERAARAQVTQRRVALQFHQVKAAVPGVIGDIPVRIGDYVAPGSPLTSIAASEDLELSVGVPAARARSLAPGAVIEILDDAGQPLLSSTVFFVAPEASGQTQLVELKATFHNTARLRAAELVPVRLVYATRDALQVPATAVVRQSGQAFVFEVLDKDGAQVVQRRPVTLGPLGDKAYVLESGLAAGARVAVSAIQYLRDGAPVKIVDGKAPASGSASGSGSGSGSGSASGPTSGSGSGR